MDRKVLITGASRGIGKSIAKAFALEKDQLFLTCRNDNSFEELKLFSRELEELNGVKVSCFKCDCGDYEAVKKMFESISDIDIVVNNAGIAWMGLLTDMEPAEWQNVISTNLNSLFNTSKFAIPMMVKKQSGRIINISSVWGNVGASCEVAYSASKGGVNSFTRALAKELAPSNIQVNAIACGVIDTDMNRKHLSEEDLEELKEEIPMDRLGSPDEIAKAVLDLAKAPNYLTGQVITIDGGWI